MLVEMRFTCSDFLQHAKEYLKYSTGNLYINDRSTGSVVGQQPFGGGRMSGIIPRRDADYVHFDSIYKMLFQLDYLTGTNDKAGGPHNVLKWSSPLTIKETYVRTSDWRYSYMAN